MNAHLHSHLYDVEANNRFSDRVASRVTVLRPSSEEDENRVDMANFAAVSSAMADSVSNVSERVVFNEESWGPLNGREISDFADVPYAHFDKKVHLGRCADFSGSLSYMNQQAGQQRYEGRRRPGGENAEFAFKHDSAEDSTFSLVDTAKVQSRSRTNRPQQRNWQQSGRGGMGRGGQMGRGGGRYGQQGPGGQGGRFGGRGDGRGGRGGRGGRFGGRRQERKDRLPSLTVGPEWTMEDEFDHAQLLKLQANAPKAEDLVWAGTLDTYDESFDKLNTRTSRKLLPVRDKIFYSVTTAEDPVMSKLTVEGAGEVYATDAILAQLMAAPRSVYSWDIVAQKMDGIVYFDKRDNSSFDFLTVSETAHDTPQAGEGVEDYNTPEKLSLEATMINQNFSQQVLKAPVARKAGDEDDEEEVKDSSSTRKQFEPNPFFEEDEPGVQPASVAYRYRRFALGDMRLVVRCELNGWLNKRGEDQYYNIYSLNEWDSKMSNGVNWRQKVDQQRGAVLVTELKNNSCKLAKWTAQSILSGADQMKVGYVSRLNPSTPFDHTILGTDKFKPKDLAVQINLNVSNLWGIVKMLAELIMKKENGKYVILKDPNKSTIRVYAVPMDTFDPVEEDTMETVLEDDVANTEDK